MASIVEAYNTEYISPVTPHHNNIVSLPLCEALILDTTGEHETIAASAARLGYRCSVTTTSREALTLIAENNRIGIIIARVEGPHSEALDLLEQISARYLPLRTLVPIMVTGRVSTECALIAMRLQAADMVEWPDRTGSLGTALGRAHARWQQQSRVAQGEWGLGTVDALLVRSPHTYETDAPDDRQMQKIVRSIIGARRLRDDHFSTELFGEPAWDMLLDLASARLDGNPVPVLSACAASCVPTSTALRWIAKLIDAGLIRRWRDPVNRRRDLIELTDEAFDRFRELLVRTRLRYVDRF